jgi:hypothetical protein
MGEQAEADEDRYGWLLTVEAIEGEAAALREAEEQEHPAPSGEVSPPNAERPTMT